MQKIKKTGSWGICLFLLLGVTLFTSCSKFYTGTRGEKRKPFTMKRGRYPYIRHFSVDQKEMPDTVAKL